MRELPGCTVINKNAEVSRRTGAMNDDEIPPEVLTRIAIFMNPPLQILFTQSGITNSGIKIIH